MTDDKPETKTRLYLASFTGRLIGAIGVSYQITDTTHGKDREEARLNLYDRYENIHGLRLTEVFDDD